MANIHTSIICKNIAPLVDLKYNISSSSLKFAIFANNGSGKTFISRLFRLLENDETLLIDGAGNNITDAYLTYGKTTGEFSLNISPCVMTAVRRVKNVNCSNLHLTSCVWSKMFTDW